MSKNYYSAQIVNSKEFDDFRTLERDGLRSQGIYFVLGIKDGKTGTQSIRFDKDKWDKKSIKKWLDSHKKKAIKVTSPQEESWKTFGQYIKEYHDATQDPLNPQKGVDGNYSVNTDEAGKEKIYNSIVGIGDTVKLRVDGSWGRAVVESIKTETGKCEVNLVIMEPANYKRRNVTVPVSTIHADAEASNSIPIKKAFICSVSI